jgi:integrase
MYKFRLYQVSNSPIWRVGIGRKVRESTHTCDKDQAREYAKALAERLWQIEKLGNRAAVPFGETAERWLIDTASPKTADRERLDWLLGRADCNQVDDSGAKVPNLTHESLSAVADPRVWDQLRAHGRAMGWTLSTIDRTLTTVSSVLNFAHRRGDLAHKVSLPKYNPKLKEPPFLTEDQFRRLYAELPDHTQLWARFAVATLLRMRAMLGLTWARVDLKRRVAWIPADEEKNEETFKFPLSVAAVAVLREVRAAQAAEYAAYVERCRTRYHRVPNPPPEHVFTYRLKPVDDANGAAFKAACRRAGVPWCTWHILGRHTGASWGAQNGVTLEERMKVGGWKDMRMALRYSHLEDSQAHAAAAVVAQKLHTALIVKSPRREKKRA